jgi:hypothetical protein
MTEYYSKSMKSFNLNAVKKWKKNWKIENKRASRLSCLGQQRDFFDFHVINFFLVKISPNPKSQIPNPKSRFGVS